jgi:hypothetical protein
MKIIITESKLHNSIYEYIDESFNVSNINWVYGIGEDENGYEDIDIEDKNFIIFYYGDWDGEYDSDIIFNYFDVDYYDKNDPAHKPFIKDSPVLEVMREYAKHLDSIFGNHWHEPMKKWFQDNFKLPVKSVSTYYHKY